MKKTVVTGASGFVGIHLIRELLNTHSDIYAIVRPHSRNINRIPEDARIHVLELSMNEYQMLPDRIGRADNFFHLAWEGVRAPQRDDTVLQENNYKYSVAAFQAAIQMGCSFFLGSGSQAEYGVTKGSVDEEYPCSPITEYGKQKLHTYEKLLLLSSEVGIRFIWPRIFSIYGPHDYPGTLVMQCIEKMKKNERIEMTEGTQLWDYLFVEDAARAMAMFSVSDCASGAYVLASGKCRPLCEFIKEMKEVLNSGSDLVFGAVPYSDSGPINLTPNPYKIKTNLNWKPYVSFRDGIMITAGQKH